jgi:hypothetical protein
MVLKTTSNKTEVRKEGGRPPFYPLATTLCKYVIIIVMFETSGTTSGHNFYIGMQNESKLKPEFYFSLSVLRYSSLCICIESYAFIINFFR